MTRSPLFIFLFSIILNSCITSSTSFTTNGSLRIGATKKNVDALLDKVHGVVENMPHDEIKREIAQKYPTLSIQSIQNIVIKCTKMWSFDQQDPSAQIFIKTYIKTELSQTRGTMNVINYYETFIIEELEKYGIYVEEKDDNRDKRANAELGTFLEKDKEIFYDESNPNTKNYDELIVENSGLEKEQPEQQESNNLPECPVIYSVQILATAKPIPLDSKEFRGLNYKIEQLYYPSEPKYRYKYVVGSECSMTKIRKIRREIKRNGFGRAFIVKRENE